MDNVPDVLRPSCHGVGYTQGEDSASVTDAVEIFFRHSTRCRFAVCSTKFVALSGLLTGSTRCRRASSSRSLCRNTLFNFLRQGMLPAGTPGFRRTMSTISVEQLEGQRKRGRCLYLQASHRFLMDLAMN